ncbi:STAS domain-containing protein [Mycobacterium sp. IDR2000157661]|uniref:STAS domain-containing protein n=1 Tax=Mycobacterium sp. IDR2000157661 TaxID=2867005 RepID=UPI00351D3D86
MSDGRSAMTTATRDVDAVAVLTAVGTLDASTYLILRDDIMKAALDEPAAVIIVIDQLEVPAESAFAVFTSARWLVGTWPEVPIVLVHGRESVRRAIVRNGVSRYVPVYPTLAAALTDPARTPVRRRARVELSAQPGSLKRSRDLIVEWLTVWSQAELIPAAKVVATTLVENVLLHTDSCPAMRLETDGTTVTIAVSDANRAPPSMPEAQFAGRPPSGLRIVSALCRAWGCSPTPTGKTVWARLGPENRL